MKKFSKAKVNYKKSERKIMSRAIRHSELLLNEDSQGYTDRERQEDRE